MTAHPTYQPDEPEVADAVVRILAHSTITVTTLRDRLATRGIVLPGGIRDVKTVVRGLVDRGLVTGRAVHHEASGRQILVLTVTEAGRAA